MCCHKVGVISFPFVVVIFTWVESRYDGVVRIEEVGRASRTFPLAVFGDSKFETVCTWEAENVTCKDQLNTWNRRQVK